MQVLMQNTLDALRRDLLDKIRRSGDYSYPETESGYVSGVFEAEPNLELLADFCRYVTDAGKTVYDGEWSAGDLFSFLENKLRNYHCGDSYSIILSFGSILPPLALLPFLSVYSQINAVDIKFLHDKWEVRGDYSADKHIGLKLTNGKITGAVFTNPSGGYSNFDSSESETYFYPSGDHSMGQGISVRGTIEYQDKIFVLTGFDEKEEKKLTDLIVANGGLVKSSVVLATNYLVVNLNYKGAATTKYKRAIELNGKGKNILIVAGSDIFDFTPPTPYIKWSKVRDNVDVEFQGKIFVLTGFDSVTEKEGASFIIRNGGIVKNSVSLDVDYLVVNRSYAGEETSEYKRALELNKARPNIRIISYERLLNSIEYKSAATWSAICDSVVVEYKGKIFVFTGFDHSTVEVLSSLVFRQGGDVKGSLSPDTDYLIVNSSYTGEETVSYKRALELNKNGKNIRIISDKKLHASLSAKKG